ncbi:dephospho-CoA kinase [Alkaliphilus oremlandii]|uniref:Dephospho-CoA kinase n=1 Tax=Alkaliphilus oremlandii (strain OhILAs) TaxID=350688 RepID=A8MF84_ALKOO|nr:dephospho-CoA kinase [Alkaliphilus oremlandii]ABW18753.1 dephospho-CoA kinase [Alkaliphilus oremlandii OhILAs]
MQTIGMMRSKMGSDSMVRTIGLTGGIASGKSTASSILKKFGASIIDADKIARKVVEKGKPALKEIVEFFGADLLLEDGTLDRKKLGTLVFNDSILLEELNRITHPHIYQEIIDEINWYKKTDHNHVIILDAALLIEMKLMDLVEEVWLISVPEEIQLARLMERENISLEDAKKRVKAQMALEEKKQYAHRIIDNSKDVVYLKSQLEEIWNRLI